MSATGKLYDLWFEVKKEGDCTEYVDEMCLQLQLLGTETNSLTRSSIKEKLENVIEQINKTL